MPKKQENKGQDETARARGQLYDQALVKTLRSISEAIAHACDYNVKGVRASLCELNAGLADLEELISEK